MCRDRLSIERTPKKPVHSKSKTFSQIAWKTSKRGEFDKILYQSVHWYRYSIHNVSIWRRINVVSFFSSTIGIPYEYIYLCDSKIQVLSHFWWDSESTQNFIFFFFRVAEVTFRWKKNSFEYFDEFCFERVLEYLRKIPIDVEFGEKQRVRIPQGHILSLNPVLNGIFLEPFETHTNQISSKNS